MFRSIPNLKDSQLPLILASTSPRRQALLTQAHIRFEVLATEIDETQVANESASDYILRMVNAKTNALSLNLTPKFVTKVRASDGFADGLSVNANDLTPANDLANRILVLTADTIGVLNDEILTKPKNKSHALAMWQAMSGQTHEVWTAVQLSLWEQSKPSQDGQNQNELAQAKCLWRQHRLDKTSVTLVPLTQAMMDYYWATGEPQDKAGGYAIQGFGATWVQAINGNYSNVVGLPLPRVIELITIANHWHINNP